MASTLSMTADKMLRVCCNPEAAIIDEACQGAELESLLGFLHNCETIKLIIMIGDPKQLPPTVISRLMAMDGKEINIFAD